MEQCSRVSEHVLLPCNSREACHRQSGAHAFKSLQGQPSARFARTRSHSRRNLALNILSEARHARRCHGSLCASGARVHRCTAIAQLDLSRAPTRLACTRAGHFQRRPPHGRSPEHERKAALCVIEAICSAVALVCLEISCSLQRFEVFKRFAASQLVSSKACQFG